MANREKIAIGEYYHIYNRGIEKGLIIKDNQDSKRFIDSLEFFNSKEPVRSLREVLSDKTNIKEPLVEIICYNLNQNHFHLLIKEINDGGISEFMKRVGGGYTWYFNNKHKRSGSLFQGTFKSVHIDSNQQLLHVSAYINLNHRVHKISGLTADEIKSSWSEYLGKGLKNICKKEVILEQFKSTKDYKDFADSTLCQIMDSREDRKGMEMIIGKYFY